jgi:hypothetical protein
MGALSSITLLYAEEIKSAVRGRFSWLAAAVILLAVGGLATVGTQDTWLDGYGIIAYGLVPFAFIPIAAGIIACPRVNRFVECVFTAPVKRSEWLAAKILVVLTLAAAYYIALIPMLLVYARHVGIPPLLHHFLLWTPGLLFASVSIGTLIGVLFVGNSLAAPVGTGVGILLIYAGLIPLQELLVGQGNGATRSGHLTLMSPGVLLKNALGFSLVTSTIPTTTAATWASIALLIIGPLLLAIWIFLRAQGVETWESTRPQKWIIGLTIAALVLIPITFADTNYDQPAPKANNAPAIRGVFSRNGAGVALVSPGASPPYRCCSTILNRDEWPMSTDQQTTRDLLVFLPIDSDRPIANLHAQITGENGLNITSDPSQVHLEPRTYRNDTGPLTEDGHHIIQGWMARIPITLNPTNPWDIGGDRYPIDIKLSYNAAPKNPQPAALNQSPDPSTFSARAAIDAQVGPAIYQMGAAALILPFLCFAASFHRWRSTR